MKSIQEAKERMAQKPIISMNNQKILDQMEESESDDDIFPDAGDYITTTSVNESKSVTSQPKQYFKVIHFIFSSFIH